MNVISENITKQIIVAAKESISNITLRPNEPYDYLGKQNDPTPCIKMKRNEVTTLLRERKRSYFKKLAEDLRRSSTSSKSWYKTASKCLLFDSLLSNPL